MPRRYRHVLTTSRHGRFTAKCPLGVHKCGPRETSEFGWRVTAVAERPMLNESGFLIDNAEMRLYFEQRYGNANAPEMPSCEIMAKDAAEYFWARLHGLQSVTVQIENTSQTTFDWSIEAEPAATLPSQEEAAEVYAAAIAA